MTMVKMRQKRTVLCCIGVVAAFFLLMTGCSGLQSKGEGSESAAMQKEKEAAPIYYDFGDVLIPKELKIIKKSSFVFRTPGLSAGVLSLKGGVEVSSLIAFFETNMAKDNWNLVSSFKSPRTIFLFQKENRWCVINITDSDFRTHVEIWVAPTIDEGNQGLLK